MDAEQRYLDARRRAGETVRALESLRQAREEAEAEASSCLEQLVAEAERSEDAVVREAAAVVRRRREALRCSGNELARTLGEAIERLVAADADSVAFGESADALALLVIHGRSSLTDCQEAVLRAEAALTDLL